MTAQLYDLTITLTPETDADVIIAPAGESGAGTSDQLILSLTAFYSGAGGGIATKSQGFTATTTQTVTHNLGRYPLVQVVDNFGFQVDEQVQHISANEFIVMFNTAESGTILYY